MGFCGKTYLRLCFAGVVMVLGDMEKVLFFFSLYLFISRFLVLYLFMIIGVPCGLAC
jgi:hypothetical protein